MAILRDAGCKPNEPIEIAQVQEWAEKNGFADLLSDALSSVSELGWVDDDGDPDNGK